MTAGSRACRKRSDCGPAGHGPGGPSRPREGACGSSHRLRRAALRSPDAPSGTSSPRGVGLASARAAAPASRSPPRRQRSCASWCDPVSVATPSATGLARGRSRRMLRCPEAPEWGGTQAFLRSLPRPESRGRGTCKFAPSSAPVTKTTVRTENGPPWREVPPGPRGGGSCPGRRHPPPKHLPAPASRLRGRLVHRSPPWVRTALGSNPDRVQESGGCEPPLGQSRQALAARMALSGGTGLPRQPPFLAERSGRLLRIHQAPRQGGAQRLPA